MTSKWKRIKENFINDTAIIWIPLWFLFWIAIAIGIIFGMIKLIKFFWYY